ncbi:MAG: FkbM family methyltransferase [Flavobacteriales bacterium]|nr:FkbM family methyltransferase [Flavobacteriales bacterium]
MLARFKLHLQREWQARRHGRDATERRAMARTLHALDKAAAQQSRPGEVAVPILGHPMRGFSVGALRYLFNEVFLTGEYRFECERPDPVIIDCGANIGFATLYFKRLFPRSTVHAFEANPNAFRLLEANVKGNALSNVHLNQVALSDAEGELSFFISDDAGTLLGSVRSDRGGTSELKVKATRLSNLIASLDRVDAVKIDVEGAEWHILKDLQESGTLAKPMRYLIEYHHQMGSDAPRLSEFLAPFEAAGYRYQIAGKLNAITDFQDVLIHLQRGG